MNGNDDDYNGVVAGGGSTCGGSGCFSSFLNTSNVSDSNTTHLRSQPAPPIATMTTTFDRDGRSGSDGCCWDWKNGNVGRRHPLQQRHQQQQQPEPSTAASGEEEDDEFGDILDTLEDKFTKQLTFQERNAIVEEIHGVRKGDIETSLEESDPTHVEQSLRELAMELQKIPRKESEDYRRACFLAPSKFGSDNKKFGLMFLRSTRYDPVRAAKKIVAFFKVKSRLFGPNKVAKDITMEDLGEDNDDGGSGLTALQSGSLIQLPLKDMAGRKVILATLTEHNTTNSETKYIQKVKSDWYVLMNALKDDEECQRSGIVIISYHVNATFQQQSRFIKNLFTTKDVYPSIPYKIVAYHYCYSNPILRTSLAFTKLIQYFNQTELKQRLREHYGQSHVECQYSLMAYGINISSLTVDMNGRIKYEFVKNYIKKQHQQEDAISSRTIDGRIIEATCEDVVLGRGVPHQTHPGNVRLAGIINMRHIEYHLPKTSRMDKTLIAWDIVKKIQEDGRFLERDGDYWKVVDDETARSKVAYGFRSKSKMDKKRKIRRQQERHKRAQQHQYQNQMAIVANSISMAQQKQREGQQQANQLPNIGDSRSHETSILHETDDDIAMEKLLAEENEQVGCVFLFDAHNDYMFDEGAKPHDNDVNDQLNNGNDWSWWGLTFRPTSIPTNNN